MSASELRDAILPVCPCCHAAQSLASFETARQVDGELTELLLCRSCLVVINSRAYAAGADSSPSASQYGDFYATEGMDKNTHLASIEKAKINIIQYFLDRAGIDPNISSFCEIGIGRGYTALAAAQLFKTVYAIDLDLRHFSRVCREIGVSENLVAGRTFADVSGPIDVLLGWHSLEHLPQPLDFLAHVRRRMNPRGFFYFQVPLLRPQYVVTSHYIFYNETAIRNLFSRSGADVIEIGFDTDLGCLTAIAQLQT